MRHLTSRPIAPHITLILGLLLAMPTVAQESLAACSKRKVQQKELIERQRAGNSARTYKRRGVSAAQRSQKIEQIEVWLWKNCRYHAEEMRSIEQQYM